MTYLSPEDRRRIEERMRRDDRRLAVFEWCVWTLIGAGMIAAIVLFTLAARRW